ncbi:MAG: RNA-binding protein [Alphaproteobacteria bacterium]
MTRKVNVAERRCIVSGTVLPQPDLVRFVIGPDGTVVPDVKGRLPGRGIWVSASRSAVDRAADGKAFARAARARVVVPEGLSDLIEQQIAARCLGLLGLARKAGDLVSGFEKVKEMLRQGVACLVVASDAAKDGREKMERLAGECPVVSVFSRDELSLALGRENVVHAALRDGGLARRFLAETSRLAGFRQESAVIEPVELRG